MTIMETKNVNMSFITIEEESGSDLSNDDFKEINLESGLEETKLLLPTEVNDDDADGSVTKPQSRNAYRPAVEDHDQEEKAPLLRQNHPKIPSIKKGRFTVSKSPDISKADFYSANIESIFQNMEPLSRKPKPNLKVDIEKANGPDKEKVSFDLGSGKSPMEDTPPHKDAIVSLANETANPPRRPSKLFTVINYGNVSTEHIPASSPAPSTRLDTEKLSWPNQHRDSQMLYGSHPHLKDLFHSQGRLHPVHEDRRRSSLRSNFKYGPPVAPKPRVRLVSGTHSVNVNDSDADDILSLSSVHTTGSHFQLFQKPDHLSISDITSKPDILPHISRDNDVTDNKYAVETVRGSLGQMSKTLLDLAKRGRLFANRKTGRLIMKDGTPNIDLKNIKTRNKKFMLDIFTTVLDIQWRYVLFLFCLAFVFSWLAFAGGWLLIAYIHGDLDGTSEMNCVDNVDSFYTALLFSIETQHTIGYGTRAITAYCPPTFFLFMLQSIFGVIVQCVMAGIIFAKLAKPKHRAATIMFSKKAVVCKKDGEYCLNFRVADMRSSQLVGATLHAMFVKKKVTKEGEVIPFHQHHMEIKTECEDRDQFIFLAWPIRIVHHIDSNSPLWNTSAEQLLKEDFEIIVILEGCIESSGMTTQIRTSYLPCEVLWGQTLSNMQTSRNGFGKQEIDYRNFHETLPAELPECSAKEYYEHYQNSVW